MKCPKCNSSDFTFHCRLNIFGCTACDFEFDSTKAYKWRIGRLQFVAVTDYSPDYLGVISEAEQMERDNPDDRFEIEFSAT